MWSILIQIRVFNITTCIHRIHSKVSRIMCGGRKFDLPEHLLTFSRDSLHLAVHYRTNLRFFKKVRRCGLKYFAGPPLHFCTFSCGRPLLVVRCRTVFFYRFCIFLKNCGRGPLSLFRTLSHNSLHLIDRYKTVFGFWKKLWRCGLESVSDPLSHFRTFSCVSPHLKLFLKEVRMCGSGILVVLYRTSVLFPVVLRTL